jgi:hypothetical protein
MLSVDPELATPAIVDGQPASQVRLDLTVYVIGPSETELELLLS